MRRHSIDTGQGPDDPASWSWGESMTGTRSSSIGRDAVGNLITTGDKNRVDAVIDAKLAKVVLPAAGSINISDELAKIRAILERSAGEHEGKVARALDDADEEATKSKPNKDEIGTALSRALDYAKKGNGFAEQVGKLVPQVTNAVAKSDDVIAVERWR